jgi:probable HAF family extracellular repeat protein
VDTVANGINNNREIIGTSTDSSAASHGFTLVGTTYTTLDFPGATGTIPNEVNDAGQIVGQYTGPYGSLDFHGFLATPVSGAAKSASPRFPR